jgi:K+-sensing histidine kinase KdpD
MSIQAALDFVLEGNGDHEKNERLLAEARSQSQKIALFLRDLLDISQLTQGRELPLNIKPVNLIDLLTAIVTENQTEAIEINFELDVPDAVPLIATDKVKTTSVFHKLVAYAKGRSEPGDVLKITVEELDNDVVVSILDSGVPLSPQQHQQIFWQVYPLEANKNNGAMPYGYGLGLYSVRRLVELLGGNIWVSQPAPRGVSLNVTLPIWR